MKKIKIILTIIALLSILIAGLILLDLRQYAGQSASPNHINKFVTIHRGESFKTLTAELHQAALIRYPYKFRIIARFKGYDKQIKAGEYQLSPTLSPLEILNILTLGKIYLHRLTVPEGYNLHQIATLIAQAGLETEENFLKAAENTAAVKAGGIDADTFEGYLFPNTYYFPKGIRADQIIAEMVRQFWKVFTPEWKKRAQNLNLSVHQIVTLASMIEKETGTASERPLIASVFHNRLKKRIRLASDPTVIYGLKNFDGNITRKHLTTYSPYNTYLIHGLPPGPIANPGIKSLEAALYPEETNFLYFVSKRDNTHKFSKNIKDHYKAVRKYQLSR
ncbi:MAG: endolytic transglycosylase MltG [Desulfobacterales bacterium]|nr:endolytic transglycosylase MltG [Desulfobacterales bacterium]